MYNDDGPIAYGITWSSVVFNPFWPGLFVSISGKWPPRAPNQKAINDPILWNLDKNTWILHLSKPTGKVLLKVIPFICTALQNLYVLRIL